MKSKLHKSLQIASCIIGHAASTAAPVPESEVMLFSYFRDNGKDGVFLATSEDGGKFKALNDDKPVFTPPKWPGQNLTRDPSIVYRDGIFHMVWTSNWTGRVARINCRIHTDSIKETRKQLSFSIPIRHSDCRVSVASVARAATACGSTEGTERHRGYRRAEYAGCFAGVGMTIDDNDLPQRFPIAENG